MVAIIAIAIGHGALAPDAAPDAIASPSLAATVAADAA